MSQKLEEIKKMAKDIDKRKKEIAPLLANIINEDGTPYISKEWLIKNLNLTNEEVDDLTEKNNK